jgi:two-component system, response regulator PdtaR
MTDASAKRPVVLVVEDDYLIRKNAVAIIDDAGFQVVEADNADDALEILEANSNIHIVFTDIQMPGSIDGLKLAKFVKDRWPPIKIVATSGRFKVDTADLPKDVVFVPKPYDPDHLVATLRELASN